MHWKHYRCHSRLNQTSQEKQNNEKPLQPGSQKKTNCFKICIMLCYPISFHWHISVSFVILLILCVNVEHTENKYKIAIQRRKNIEKNRLSFPGGLVGLVISLYHHHNHITLFTSFTGSFSLPISRFAAFYS